MWQNIWRSNNVCPICHRLQDIQNRKVHNLGLDLYILSRSSIKIERSHATSCVLAIAIFVPSFIVCEIITYELHNLTIRTFSLEMKVKYVDDLYKYLLTNLPTCICVKIIGASRSSRLIAVDKRTFRGGRTHERTFILVG